MTSQAEEQIVDIDAIAPDASGKFVVGTFEVRVRRLKTREFLALMKVLTSGLGGGLAQVRIDFSTPEHTANDFAALMLLAVPNAVEEFAVFLATVVEPVNPDERAAVARYLHDNPELDEMLSIFEAIAVQEREDLSMLAGKAQAMWTRIAPLYTRKTG